MVSVSYYPFFSVTSLPVLLLMSVGRDGGSGVDGGVGQEDTVTGDVGVEDLHTRPTADTPGETTQTKHTILPTRLPQSDPDPLPVGLSYGQPPRPLWTLGREPTGTHSIRATGDTLLSG